MQVCGHPGQTSMVSVPVPLASTGMARPWTVSSGLIWAGLLGSWVPRARLGRRCTCALCHVGSSIPWGGIQLEEGQSRAVSKAEPFLSGPREVL